MAKDFITIQEASEHLGKSAQTIRRMIKRGDLVAKRIRTPQGFHYVLSKDQVFMDVFSSKVSKVKNSPVLTEADDKVSMLSNTSVQKPISAQAEATEDSSTSQKQIPTNQSAQQPHTPAINSTVDRNKLAKVIERHHKENLFLFHVIERLQHELDNEKRRPKSFFAYFFDWLSH
jgi:excisionase family DNA binding protein